MEIDAILSDRKHSKEHAIKQKKAKMSAAKEEQDFSKLPDKYADLKNVFSKKSADDLPPHRSYNYKITLEKDKTLGYSPLYKISTAELEILKEHLEEDLHKGFISPSQAPWASPVLFVLKPGGGLRFCVDYRKLNSITKKDRYPIPLIDEILARINIKKIFTKLDIRAAFNRIRMHPDSVDLTTFRTRYGSYKCEVMPFGVTNRPATFQRFINDVLFDYLDDFCSAFIDDILIFSDNEAEHEIHVRSFAD